jgi:NADH:ubiquinone oxidoreductase subunit D
LAASRWTCRTAGWRGWTKSSSTRNSWAASTLCRNRIFIDRTRNIGAISTADAVHWGFTGPILRSTGAPRDLRKDTPYLAYAELDFEVPVGIKGDNYDRYYVRMREMDESVHMIRQLMDLLPDGPINVDDHRCTLPEKRLVYSEIESLINHFKLSWTATSSQARSTSRMRRPTASSLLPRERWQERHTRCTCAAQAAVHMAGCTACWRNCSRTSSDLRLGEHDRRRM